MFKQLVEKQAEMMNIVIRDIVDKQASMTNTLARAIAENTRAVIQTIEEAGNQLADYLGEQQKTKQQPQLCRQELIAMRAKQANMLAGRSAFDDGDGETEEPL